MLISSFRKKIYSVNVNSQLSKEINFEILFCNLEHVLFCETLRKKFHLWSAVIGQSASVYKHRYELSVVYGFRKFISSVKVLSFKRKNLEIFISK